MNISFDFYKCQSFNDSSKRLRFHFQPTIHMSSFQREKHNVTRLNSHKDTRYDSVTEPIGSQEA